MSENACEPTLFVSTGLQKSGNTWSEMMLWSMPGIGGFATCASRGLPMTLQNTRCVPDLMAMLDEHGVSLAEYLCAMMGVPGRETGLFPAEEGERVRKYAGWLRSASLTMKDNFYDEPDRRNLTTDQFVSRLMDPAPASTEHGATEHGAMGLPSKHVPPHTLREWLPGWKIVQFLRDPRDVLVSTFYHDLGYLDRVIETLVDRSDESDPKLLVDWKRRYFTDRLERMLAFHEDRGADPLKLVVRYEDTLADAAAELCRISRFLGVEPDERAASEIAERYAFKTVTGGTSERRNSAIRKGKAGDWRRYFDRELVEILGEPFRELIVHLGYEPDDGWVERVPERADAQWDFSRFRRGASVVQAFMSVWYASEDLHRRYPIPTDFRREDNFFTWLEANATPEVQRWLDLTERLSERWGVDIIENQYH